MKYLKLTAMLIISVHLNVFGQWDEKSITTNNTLTSVDFFDDDIGFVVGGNKIFKTSSGGDLWTVSYMGSSLIAFEDVFIIDENNVIAVGKDLDSGQSAMVRTDDNGNTWEAVNIANSSFLKSVFFVSSDIGYCSGGGGLILKTTDSGNTWQALNSGTSMFLQSIYFVDEENGIAVGGTPSSSIIVKTQDGGTNWSQINAPSDNFLQSAYFINQQIGYVVGWNGQIMKTEDGGSTWQAQTSVNMAGNLEVLFTDENTGYIVGGQQNESSIQKTENGGGLWEDISPDIPVGLVGIDFPSFSTGYAVGGNGTVVKTESGGMLTSTGEAAFPHQVLVYPNPVTSIASIKSTGNQKIESIKLYDNSGRLIKYFSVEFSKVEIDFSEFEPNIYFLEINTGKGKYIKKLIRV